MKKARTRLFAMTLAIIIFSLCAFPASAQTVSESASQFLRTQAAVRLTAAEEAEVKEAVLNNEINESNQENILKLAMKQYLNRSRTAQVTLSSTTDNDEWIILQEVETEEFTPLNSVLFNQSREKQLVATAFLVLDENGKKVTPSMAVASLDVTGTLYPGTSENGLSQYFVYGAVTHYATAEFLGAWYPVIDKLRIDKIVTVATNARPSVAIIGSFNHFVWAGNNFETKYQKDSTVNSPVSDREYTLTSSDMGFHTVQNSPQADDIRVGAMFYTTGAENFQIIVSMYEFYRPV